MNIAAEASLVKIRAGAVALEGILELPEQPSGVVVFSHGSGSGRQFAAQSVRRRPSCARARLGTLLLDLLTPEEDRDYEMRFDIDLLTRAPRRTRCASSRREPATYELPIGLFGASTGAASALRVAAGDAQRVRAVVSRGGRPDLAGEGVLARVKAPTLLIVGAEDARRHRAERSGAATLLCAASASWCSCRGATHLFEEPGTLEAGRTPRRRMVQPAPALIGSTGPSALDADERLEPRHLAREPGRVGRVDHCGDVLVGPGRFLGDAAHRGALDQDAARGEIVDHLAALPGLAAPDAGSSRGRRRGRRS